MLAVCFSSRAQTMKGKTHPSQPKSKNPSSGRGPAEPGEGAKKRLAGWLLAAALQATCVCDCIAPR